MHCAALLCPAADFESLKHQLPASMRTVHVAMDEHLPLAGARNALAAVGAELGADLLVFLDADCLPAPSLLRHYCAAHAQLPTALLAGPVTYLTAGESAAGLRLGAANDRAFSHAPVSRAEIADMTAIRRPHSARPAPSAGEVEIREARSASAGDYALFWSLSFALTPRVFARIGGFDTAYRGYGGEDTDFGRCARLAGVDLAWVGGAEAVHVHHPVSSPPVEHVADIVVNARVFFERWGEWPMRGWIEAFAAMGLVQFDPARSEAEAGLRLTEQSGR